MTCAAADTPHEIRKGLGAMRTFILVGWAIYPLGYVATLVASGPETQLARDFVYNVADLVNKVGLGLVAVWAARDSPFARAGRRTQYRAPLSS